MQKMESLSLQDLTSYHKPEKNVSRALQQLKSGEVKKPHKNQTCQALLTHHHFLAAPVHQSSSQVQ